MDVSRYTIISNNCVGARMYRYLGVQFDNPFIWCWLFYDDMLTVLDYWDEINFNEYALIKDNNLYGIKVNSKFTIYYPHYKKDESCVKPTRTMSGENGLDIRYRNIESYIKERYTARVSRMGKYEPFFVFVQSEKTKLGTFDALLEVQKKLINNNYKSIILCNNEKLKKYETENNLIIVYEKDLATTDTNTIAIDLIKKLGIHKK